MTRIVVLLFVVAAAMGAGIAASPEEPRPPERAIPLPAPLAMVERAQKACGGVLKHTVGDEVWRCVLSDEFDGSRLDLSRWTAVQTADKGFSSFSSGIPPAYACYRYSPETVSVAGGYLNLSVAKLDDEIECGGPARQPTEYIGGAVSSRFRLAQTYGRYDIRARFATDEESGLQSSLILQPDVPKYGLQSGEIDIAEYFTEWSDRVIPFVRYDHPGDDPTETSDDCRIENPDQFHRYTLEWTSSLIEMWVDGRPCLSTTWSMGTNLHRPAPFDQPFVLTMFQAFGASGAAPDLEDMPDIPATMQVDYVHVWGVRDE